MNQNDNPSNNSISEEINKIIETRNTLLKDGKKVRDLEDIIDDLAQLKSLPEFHFNKINLNLLVQKSISDLLESDLASIENVDDSKIDVEIPMINWSSETITSVSQFIYHLATSESKISHDERSFEMMETRNEIVGEPVEELKKEIAALEKRKMFEDKDIIKSETEFVDSTLDIEERDVISEGEPEVISEFMPDLSPEPDVVPTPEPDVVPTPEKPTKLEKPETELTEEEIAEKRKQEIIQKMLAETKAREEKENVKIRKVDAHGQRAYSAVIFGQESQRNIKKWKKLEKKRQRKKRGNFFQRLFGLGKNKEKKSDEDN